MNTTAKAKNRFLSMLVALCLLFGMTAAMWAEEAPEGGEPAEQTGEAPGEDPEAGGEGTQPPEEPAVQPTDGSAEVGPYGLGDSYIITFDYQGADSGNDVVQINVVNGYSYGTLPSPGRTGYDFGGWYTEPDGAGTPYPDNGTYSVDASITLYAHWTRDETSYAWVQYDGYATGVEYRGDGSELAGPYTPGTNAPVLTQSAAGLSRYGYEVGIWRDTSWTIYPADGSGTITLSAGVTTLYAQWQHDGSTWLTVTYDGNGGWNAAGETQVQYTIHPFTNHTVPSLEYTGLDRPGHVFTGWRSAAGQTYQPGDIIDLSTDGLVLYAQWNYDGVTVYNVAYHANGGVGGPQLNLIVPGEERTLPDPADVGISNSGLFFDGWNTEADGSGDDHWIGETHPIRGNWDLYAQWTTGYSLTVQAGPGGTVTQGDPGPHPRYGEVAVTAQPQQGYTFAGWSSSGGGSFADASSESTVFTMPRGDVTVTANFTDSRNTVSIGASANPIQGGTVSGGGVYREYDTCTVQAAPAVGWTFVNWTENGSEVSTDRSYVFAVTTDRNLTANFRRTSTGSAASSGSGSRSSSDSGGSTATPSTSKSSETVQHLGGYSWSVDLPVLGFVDATVDGDTLTRGEEYMVRSGSTVLTLTDSYVNSLRSGSTHTLRMEFLSATATIDFTVTPIGTGGGDVGEPGAPALTASSNDNMNPSTGGVEAAGGIAVLLAVVGLWAVVPKKIGR